MLHVGLIQQTEKKTSQVVIPLNVSSQKQHVSYKINFAGINDYLKNIFI